MRVHHLNCISTCPAGGRLMDGRTDCILRLGNQERLRELRRSHGHEVEIFCGHDLGEFENLAGRPATIPAPDRGRAAAES